MLKTFKKSTFSIENNVLKLIQTDDYFKDIFIREFACKSDITSFHCTILACNTLLVKSLNKCTAKSEIICDNSNDIFTIKIEGITHIVDIYEDSNAVITVPPVDIFLPISKNFINCFQQIYKICNEKIDLKLAQNCIKLADNRLAATDGSLAMFCR